VAERILTPENAGNLVGKVRCLGPLRVVGVAGPGEPLANPETFETLRHVSYYFPDLLLCLSTNGLLLAEMLPEIISCKVQALTVTINAVSTAIASAIYGWARFAMHRYSGEEAAAEILSRQWHGLREAVRAGLLVKVNSVFIPGINERELPEIARRAAAIGAHRHNIMPLIPRNRFRELCPPDREQLAFVREVCGRWLAQFTGCTQCRADACVLPKPETRGSNERM
jgi:nitrogen fixation protein NifB